MAEKRIEERERVLERYRLIENMVCIYIYTRSGSHVKDPLMS